MGILLVPSRGGQERSLIWLLSAFYHPFSTAIMLPKEDGGVVDTSLKVYGTKNLRVVDASVIPVVSWQILDWYISEIISVTVLMDSLSCYSANILSSAGNGLCGSRKGVSLICRAFLRQRNTVFVALIALIASLGCGFIQARTRQWVCRHSVPERSIR